LAFVASLFNPDDLQSQKNFQVKRIFRTSVLNNQEYLQVSEKCKELDEFLADAIDSVENSENQNHIPLTKKSINFESNFTRHDHIKMPNLKQD
jgi:hypothetical protein